MFLKINCINQSNTRKIFQTNNLSKLKIELQKKLLKVILSRAFYLFFSYTITNRNVIPEIHYFDQQ